MAMRAPEFWYSDPNESVALIPQMMSAMPTPSKASPNALFMLDYWLCRISAGRRRRCSFYPLRSFPMHGRCHAGISFGSLPFSGLENS